SVAAALQGVSSAAPTGPVTVTLDLSAASVTPPVAIAVPAGMTLNLTSTTGTTVTGATVSVGIVVVGASVTTTNWTVNGGDVTVQGNASIGDFTVNGGRVTLSNGTIIGNSPALVVNGGKVFLLGMTAATDTDSSTIIVSGGQLTIRNSIIQESASSAQAAVW